MKPTLLHPLPITADFSARLALQDARLAEKREEARRDMHDIVMLWSQRCYQREHTDHDIAPDGGAA